MTVEQWLPIPGYEGRYDVSDQGQVRSWLGWNGGPVPRTLSPIATIHGYLRVTLYRDKSSQQITIHRLSALTFIGPCPEGLEVRHEDGDQLNNASTNLSYGTHSENTLDKVRHGTHNEAIKTHCPQGHPYDNASTHVDSRGKRTCRACGRARQARLRRAS